MAERHSSPLANNKGKSSDHGVKLESIKGLMNVSYLTPTPGADKWLATDDGNRLLRQRTDQASRAFLEAGLGTRLQSELLSSQIGGSKVFRIGNSVRTLSEELAILAFAHSQNLAIASEVWEIVLKNYLPILFSIKEI